MDYQTLITNAIDWLMSDMTHAVGCVAVIAVIGALNGIRCSMSHCRYTRHTGRRVL